MAISRFHMSGSSPYTWGAPRINVIGPDGERITPIYMGSTVTCVWARLTCWDHPHIHGEHRLAIINPLISAGSPPYTWGALLIERFIRMLKRITPIYMGSTALSSIMACFCQDHPHIHGEHGNILVMAHRVQGSPPYTWGAL